MTRSSALRALVLVAAIAALVLQSGRFGLHTWSSSRPTDLADRLRGACAAIRSDLPWQRLDVGPARVVITIPRDATLVTLSPEHPTLPDALAAAVADGHSVAFNVQFQTIDSNFRDTRGATLVGDAPLHAVPEGDPTRKAPQDFVTFSALAPPPQLTITAGPPPASLTGRRFAMGGLFGLRLRGVNIASWYLDGQESGHAFAAQTKGKMLFATGHSSGCVAIVAHSNQALTGSNALTLQAEADAAGLLTFSAWRDALGAAGFGDVAAFDSGISPHLVMSGATGPEVLVPMDPSAVPVLRYGARVSW